MKEKTVGILGGMGPEATVDFMQRIIRLTPAKDDGDHIHMLVDNNPKIPSRIKAIIEKTGANPLPVLVEMAKGLEKCGADFLAIPCNTAHYYWSGIQAVVKIPVLNMIQLTVQRIITENPRIKLVGLLASSAVLITGLYKRALAEQGVSILYPPEDMQNRVLQTIKKVKANAYDQEDIRNVQDVADFLTDNRAGALIVGCTELSVLANQIDFRVRFYDSSQVLAEKVLKTVKER